MKKILVPCDFSFTSIQAYEVALQISKRTNGEVHLLRVLDLPFSYESSYAAGHFSYEKNIFKTLEADARKSFDDLIKGSGSHDRLHFSVLQGPVTAVIRTYVINENIDLVVMGTNGSTGISEYLVGSNTEKVVRFSPVPVIAVRRAFELASVKNIVVPTDAGVIYPAFISSLQELQRLLSARLHLLLVRPDDEITKGNQMTQSLREFAVRAGLENYTLNLQEESDKEAGILAFVRKINADMIAMATHGRRGLSHLFAGSLTEDIVNHVDCPIWTYSIKDHATKLKASIPSVQNQKSDWHLEVNS